MRSSLISLVSLACMCSVSFADPKEKSSPPRASIPPALLKVTPQQVTAFLIQHPTLSKAAITAAQQHPQVSTFVINKYLQHQSTNTKPPTGGTVNTNAGSTSSSNNVVPVYVPYPFYPTYTSYTSYPSYQVDTTPMTPVDATSGAGTGSGTLIAKEVPLKAKTQEKPIDSAVFHKWLKVELVDKERVQMTYPGDEYPVKAVLFFSEDAEGRRLNLETVEASPLTAQLPVDNNPARIGISVKYKDGFETTLRFPFPLPVSLLDDKGPKSATR